MNKTMTLLSTALLMAGVVTSCQKATTARSAYDKQFENYPTYNGDDLELTVDNKGTHFRLWSPKAEEVILNLYDTELNGEPYKTISMTADPNNGTWTLIHIS